MIIFIAEHIRKCPGEPFLSIRNLCTHPSDWKDLRRDIHWEGKSIFGKFKLSLLF